MVETLNHLQRLTGYGVNYRSFTEQYLDSTGIFKEAVIGILAAVAKQERVRLSERTIAGLQRAKAQGRIGGRPRVSFASLGLRFVAGILADLRCRSA
jgi:DNA invertase Pin-like site-specific DNA recombinase